MGIIFAPYGNSKNFYESFKSSLDAPSYVSSIFLNGYEYMCNEGVHISDDACIELKANADKYNIALSVRAYDFLGLSSLDEEKRRKSIKTLCHTVKKASLMGAERVVFPLDNCAIRPRKEVFEMTLTSLNAVMSYMKEEKIENVFLCPETMGLIHNLGTMEEVISLCMTNEKFLPCVSAGNIFARSCGKDKGYDFYVSLIEKFEKKLGRYRSENFHLYYSKVEYTHHGFRADINFCDCDDENQSFNELLKAVKDKNTSPFIVCKSPDFCDTDCVAMKEYYFKLKD